MKQSSLRSYCFKAFTHWLTLALTITCLIGVGVEAGTNHFVTNPADSGLGTFREAVSLLVNGDTITFQAGLTITLQTTSALIIVTNNNVNITGPVVITGGSSTTQLLRIQGNDVLIRDITFTNVDVSLTDVLALAAARAVVQKCTFLLTPYINSIFFAGPSDSVLIGTVTEDRSSSTTTTTTTTTTNNDSLKRNRSSLQQRSYLGKPLQRNSNSDIRHFGSHHQPRGLWKPLSKRQPRGSDPGTRSNDRNGAGGTQSKPKKRSYISHLFSRLVSSHRHLLSFHVSSRLTALLRSSSPAN